MNQSIEKPYVIENVTIDANDKSSGIKIVDSKAYFVVRNCTLYNATITGRGYYAAIELANATNGEISENRCLNSTYGIYMHSTTGYMQDGCKIVKFYKALIYSLDV